MTSDKPDRDSRPSDSDVGRADRARGRRPKRHEKKKAERPAPARPVRRAPAPSTPPPFERGARVRVLAGPFMGRVGVVQELDGRGGARVMLGLLATRIDVADLVESVGGRERPALSSSHRKPLPPTR